MWGLVLVYEELQDNEPGMYWSEQTWGVSACTQRQQLWLPLLTLWVPASPKLVQLSLGTLRWLSSVLTACTNIYCLNLFSIRSHPEGPIMPTDILLNENPFPMWKQKLPLPVLSRSPNRFQRHREKLRQWKAQSCLPRETIEKPVKVHLHHTWCSATTAHTPARTPVLRSWELVHVHRAAPQPCSCDSEAPCTGTWHNFPGFHKDTTWLLSWQLLPQRFYPLSHKCLQLTLKPLEINGPEINLVLR